MQPDSNKKVSGKTGPIQISRIIRENKELCIFNHACDKVLRYLFIC